MITSEDISTRFAELLAAAGWTPDRRVDVADPLGKLQSEGFKPSAAATSLLESLHGLSVRLPPAGINPYEHELRFDPYRAATGDQDRAAEWEQELGIELFPLGEEVRNGTVLWAGSDGRFYFGREFGMYLLGESFGDAMDKLAFIESPLVRVAE